ncbi:hypothetical protein BKA58DRAFT_445610 [Alternaria rosae]|uniref:uncharacterized protein n=1 Tax=Alternaria rosae TaxID=1187941 RepID=UPI001E8E5A80|nr:uncharacterized protein BKA58DRAFT_445610 [Alternaria rosae]KAH6881423.1 hypothetical protein BKA58DRAFT_445610 [Alternaria rosae]
MSTEALTILGPPTALDVTNGSASTVASELKSDANCPFSKPSPNSSAATTLSSNLANLPPLPSLTHDEFEDLDPNYLNYLATINYYALSTNSTLIQETRPTPVSRTSILLFLEYFYTLRKHLTANLSILETYPGTSLARVDDSATHKSKAFTPLEKLQNESSIHHIAINETLRAVNSNWACHAFGLPDPLSSASDIRQDRSYFAHTFLLSRGKGIQLV